MAGRTQAGVGLVDLDRVATELRAILAPYVAHLQVKRDDAAELYLETKFMQKNRKPLFFGAVQVRKSFVSFHLMPVYLRPELLSGVSAELRSRMQGKSCFNFAQVDADLFRELACLTEASFANYQEQGYV